MAPRPSASSGGLRLIGTAREKAGVLSFVIPGKRTEDIGAALDKEGIAVRSGHHCAQPALRRFGLETSVRPSVALYNTREDLDVLKAVLPPDRIGSQPSNRPRTPRPLTFEGRSMVQAPGSDRSAAAGAMDPASALAGGEVADPGQAVVAIVGSSW